MSRWLRISGRAVWTEKRTAKEKVIAANPLVKSIYKSPDNPALKIFYIDDAKAVIADFSGNPPETFKLN